MNVSLFQIVLHFISKRSLRWLHYIKQRIVIFFKLLDLEFLRFQLRAMREGIRMEHDHFKEQLDASKRRLAGERYTFYYSASGDEVNFKDIPIMPDELEKLPDEAVDTKDYRFFKKAKEDPDATLVKNLETLIERTSGDLGKLKQQMEGIDNQLTGQNGVEEKIEGMRTAINLLTEYMHQK